MLSPEQVAYGKTDKYGFKVGLFGFGEITSSVSPDASPEGKLLHARKLGWAHGCPRALEVIEEYGVDWISNRYAICNFWFNYLRKSAQIDNQSLFLQLFSSKRLLGEEVGKHEPLSVPEIHKTYISPMSGLYGYAIPRLLILGKRQSGGSGESYNRARNLMRVNLNEAKYLKEFTANLIKDLSQEQGIEWIDILEHALPQGILEEENCLTTYELFGNELAETAPEIAKFYTELTPSQRAEKGIADVASLK